MASESAPTRWTTATAPPTPPQKTRRVDGYPLTPPSTPDRFIAPRRSITSAQDIFRISKSPQELSLDERLLRKRPANVDPFMSRRVTPDMNTRLGMIAEPFGARRASQTATAGTAATGPTPRSISTGSVWRVGGVASSSNPTTAVVDGHGGLLSSGTNAPMYSANFFDAETEDQGARRFEGRIAAALDVDQCRRMLDYSPPTKSPRSPTRRYANPDFPTTWQDGQWVNSQGTQSGS